MPFQYKPRVGCRRRRPFTKSEIENAVGEIKEGKSIRKVAIKYGIDRSTLRRYHLLGDLKLKTLQDKGSQYKTSQIFNQNEEKSLVNYLLTCSKMHYGLTRKQAMQLAFDYAKANSKKIPPSWTANNSAGKDWFRGFLARNQEISLRRPEATSLSRATSFNKKNVNDFFNNLRAVREKFQFEPQNIYNCDETGCTTVQACPKVIASKKCKQVGQVTSAERGTLVTLCFAVNALGNVIPPFFIFPRVRYQDVFVAEGPEGSSGDAYPSGWMTATSFVKFLEHFAKYSHASKDNRVLLLLDNHESHVSAAAINFAKDNGITLLTLPPHCSSKLQPLDVSVYASFKSRYNTAMSNWMLSNPAKTVTIYNIPGFIKSIMSQSFSQANILSGFRKTGIHPFNPDVFEEDDFLCSAVTDRELPSEEASTSTGQVHAEVELVFTLDNETPVEENQAVTHPSPVSQENVFEDIATLTTSQDKSDTNNPSKKSRGRPKKKSNPNENQHFLEPLSVESNLPTPVLGVSESLQDSFDISNTKEIIEHPIPASQNSGCRQLPSLSKLCFNAVDFLCLKQDSPFHCFLMAEGWKQASIVTKTNSCEISNVHQKNSEVDKQVSNETPQPSTSHCQLLKTNAFNTISPEIIRPFPKALPRKSVRRGRQPGKTKILTQTPEKDDSDCQRETDPSGSLTVTDDDENRDKRKRKARGANQSTGVSERLHGKKSSLSKGNQAKRQKVNNAKRKVLQDECGSNSKKNIKKITKEKSKSVKGSCKRQKLKKSRIQKFESETESEEENIHYEENSNGDDWEEKRDESWFCFVCQSDEIMDMRLCVSCRRYVHELCVGLTKNDVEEFICHDCSQM